MAQHTLLREHVEAVVENLATPALRYVTRIKNPGDEEVERRRRMRLYSRQWRDIERCFGAKVDDGCRCGSKAKAVWCHERYTISQTGESRERRRTFDSLRDAARYATRVSGEQINRSRIRTAIRSSLRCADRQWGFTDEPAKHCRTGRERAVVCETTGRHFDTQAEAAAYARIGTATMSAAMRRGGTVLAKWQTQTALKFVLAA
ncbi:MAG TPA: hypothetical protein VFC78_18535 [Tepidisphaeraceae bacterium]|nr:hypothetical protein [Tepidisphaeraceae bacterium]